MIQMESQSNLHPSVQEFKEFVKKHPGIMTEVQEGHRKLQHVYEEWTVLGADHEQWRAFMQEPIQEEKVDANVNQKQDENQTSENATSSDESGAGGTGEFLGQLMGLVKKMNVQDLQSHLTQFSSVLGNVQNLMQTFQKPQEPVRRQESDSPFSFRRD